MFYYFLLLFVGGAVCDRRPNFVVILTDDQDIVLNGMTPLANVRRFIEKEGVTFTNSYTTSPICCPSRSSLLTGLYLHNHGTRNNSLSGGCYGNKWQKHHEEYTFATALKDVGYSTFYAGKYLNQYGTKEAGGPERVPPGWTEWHGLVGNSVYYDYTISNDGVPTHSANDYLTDVIRDTAISYIENQTESEPFLMMLSPPAPHQPFTPAPRHRGLYSNVTVVTHPNFNLATHDKHWLMSMPPSPLPAASLPRLNEVYRERWETLLAVDEMVADVVGALEDRGLLDHTYLIYTSDNGYHVGQFAQMYDKRQPYETDIKVPLLIRGPNIPKDVKNAQPTLNIDIAPTILELAGVNIPKTMDGRPLNWNSGEMEERNMLVEYYGEGNEKTVDDKCPWKYDGEQLSECYPQYDCKCQDSKNNTFACIRHIAERINKKYCIFADADECYPQYDCKCQDSKNNTFACIRHIAERINKKYCIFADADHFTEMYDLSTDPYELTNIIDSVLPAVKHWYKLTLIEMLNCTGAIHCDHPFGTFTTSV